MARPGRGVQCSTIGGGESPSRLKSFAVHAVMQLRRLIEVRSEEESRRADARLAFDDMGARPDLWMNDVDTIKPGDFSSPASRNFRKQRNRRPRLHHRQTRDFSKSRGDRSLDPLGDREQPHHTGDGHREPAQRQKRADGPTEQILKSETKHVSSILGGSGGRGKRIEDREWRAGRRKPPDGQGRGCDGSRPYTSPGPTQRLSWVTVKRASPSGTP